MPFFVSRNVNSASPMSSHRSAKSSPSRHPMMSARRDHPPAAFSGQALEQPRSARPPSGCASSRLSTLSRFTVTQLGSRAASPIRRLSRGYALSAVEFAVDGCLASMASALVFYPCTAPLAGESIAFELLDPMRRDLVQDERAEGAIQREQNLLVSFHAALVYRRVVTDIRLCERAKRDVGLSANLVTSFQDTTALFRLDSLQDSRPDTRTTTPDGCVALAGLKPVTTGRAALSAIPVVKWSSPVS